ncbi:hypothetical protein HOG16_02785 [Candidatus Woesearchaeota archaeon]|jgi:hypothetical protein|nr:hypothetical protein [Candidatus Woesearchaeota archaeon]MBT4322022.1 hypothetical protein [Candidatus Woesearchaeota archaeon]MBT4630768.1 hypothetical protein [Candidatus Woesearchaeota archaeon]
MKLSEKIKPVPDLGHEKTLEVARLYLGRFDGVYLRKEMAEVGRSGFNDDIIVKRHGINYQIERSRYLSILEELIGHSNKKQDSIPNLLYL